MAATIQVRRGTASQWTTANPTLAAGEIGFETDTNQFKIGTGSTAWTSLGYAGGGGISYATTVTAAGTTTLTVSSKTTQVFTGTTTQTVVMPVTSTLTLGQSWQIHNNSTGLVTVNSSGGNLITTVPSNTSVIVMCTAITGTTAASWDVELAGASTYTGSGALVLGTSPTLSLPSIDNPRYGFTSTATAAGTTTLTVSSTFQQFFTGTTTQTVVLPVASTMVVGQGFYIENNSTGNLTVNSSGGNLVAVVIPGVTVLITNILTSGTTAASWDVDFHGFTSITGTGSVVLSTAPTLTNLILSGTLNAGGANGTSGQVLASTGTGVQWSTPSAGAAFSEFMLIGA